MTTKSILTPLLAAATVSITILTPISANASRLQNQKNNWRNIAIGAGALGVLGLANHNGTEALLGGLGAAYAGSRYEAARHRQSQVNSWRHRHYYHHSY